MSWWGEGNGTDRTNGLGWLSHAFPALALALVLMPIFRLPGLSRQCIVELFMQVTHAGTWFWKIGVEHGLRMNNDLHRTFG